MPQNIILSADEDIRCPKCDFEFPLSQGITRQTIEHYEQDFQDALKKQENALRVELAKEAERKLSREFNSQLEGLKEQLADRDRSLNESKNKTDELVRATKLKAETEQAAEQKALREELEAKDAKLRLAQEQELQLRKDKRALEEQRAELDLELQRKLDDAKKQLEQQIRNTEGERFRLIEAEYKKKIEDAQHANEDLHRKLQQGSPLAGSMATA